MTPEQIDVAIDALETALAAGELTVEYAGRRVTYKSQDDILKALEYFKRQKLQIPATGPVSSSVDRGSYAAFSRD